MAVPLTEQEAERLVRLPKTIRHNLVWAIGANEAWAKGELPVQGAGVMMSLYATVNVAEPQLFSFALSVSHSFRIRGLCHGAAHGNKHRDNRTKLYEAHVHVWTDSCRDRLAYLQTSQSATRWRMR